MRLGQRCHRSRGARTMRLGQRCPCSRGARTMRLGQRCPCSIRPAGYRYSLVTRLPLSQLVHTTRITVPEYRYPLIRIVRRACAHMLPVSGTLIQLPKISHHSLHRVKVNSRAARTMRLGQRCPCSIWPAGYRYSLVSRAHAPPPVTSFSIHRHIVPAALHRGGPDSDTPREG